MNGVFTLSDKERDLPKLNRFPIALTEVFVGAVLATCEPLATWD